MNDKPKLVDAEILIGAYGDQAYHRSLELAVEATLNKDPGFSRLVAEAAAELMKRGYHKKPRDPAAPFLYRGSVALHDQAPWMQRTGIVLATPVPHLIGQVIIEGKARLRISKRITRDEMMAQLRYNKSYADGVSAQAYVTNSRADVANAVEVDEPGPEFKYFYRAEMI